jgi:hypothetical protein
MSPQVAVVKLVPPSTRTQPSLAGRAAAWPPWVQVLAIYAATRFVAWVITERTARFQPANGWSGQNPAYLDFVRIWDGVWYSSIVESGYPLPLPVDAAGKAVQSEWAFFPAYPLLVRFLRDLSGLEFRVVAPTLSLLLGAGAAVLLYKIFRMRADHGTALTGVALFFVFPSSPVLQYAYTESLAMLALTGATYLLMTRRYLWCLLPVVLLGLTRPIGVPFGLVVLAHLVHRWLRRRDDPLPVRDIASIVLLGLVTAVSSAAWPLYVGWATGVPGAYAKVQTAWHGELEWVVPWFDMSRYVLGDWLGPVALVGLVIGFAALLVSRYGRALGVEMATWCGAYAAYMLVVVQPFTSIFRYLLLLFPLALLVARTVRSRAHLLTWLAAMVSLQVVWVVWLWRFRPPSDVPP